MVLLAHTSGPSASVLDALRAVARRPDPAVPVFDAQTIERFYYVLVEAQFGTVVRMIGGIGLMGMARRLRCVASEARREDTEEDGDTGS